MKREGLANGKVHVDKEKTKEASSNESKPECRPGDVTWIKLRGTAWWPAQVMDENAISGSNKPPKGKSGEILVRLYGTYTYAYVDLVTRHLEFDNVLKRHKGSHRELIQKGLKQDFSESQSGRSKIQKAKGKVKEKAVSAKRANEKQDGAEKKFRPNSPTSDVSPQKPGESARRLKVMLDLGLIAPSGSPFRKNGQIPSFVQL